MTSAHITEHATLINIYDLYHVFVLLFAGHYKEKNRLSSEDKSAFMENAEYLNETILNDYSQHYGNAFGFPGIVHILYCPAEVFAAA